MSTISSKTCVPESAGTSEPKWDVAQLFPNQGEWSVADYLAFDTNQLVEYSDGFVEYLPMPTLSHQFIGFVLHHALRSFVLAHKLGLVVGAPYRVRLAEKKFREPDVVFMKRENAARMGQQYSEGADLVIEVVSPDDPNRDLVTKRDEYARAGIPEYWIVEPKDGRITVLTLRETVYEIHGEFRHGDQATSKLLPGFAVDVTSALTAEE